MSAWHRVALVVGLMIAAAALPVLAAESPPWEEVGQITGSSGGTTESYDVNFPPSTHVTLNLHHAPCELPEEAVLVKAYGPHGEFQGDRTTESCSRQFVFYTIAGGEGRIEVQNFLPGVGLHYSLTSDSVKLPSGAVQGGGPTPTASPMPPAPTSVSGTLAGKTGGAATEFPVTPTLALPHTIVMTYTMASGGGTWDGVGFKVTSAADGSVLATSSESAPNTHSATFVPTPNMNLWIEVFNYNNGQSMSYGLSGLPAGESG